MTSFLPHGMCLLWDHWILGRVIIGNVLTASAYLLITLGLIQLYRVEPRVGVPRTNVRIGIGLFATFIFMCGCGHIWDIIVLWWPLYRYESWWKLGTGVISVLAAVWLAPVIISFYRNFLSSSHAVDHNTWRG